MICIAIVKSKKFQNSQNPTINPRSKPRIAIYQSTHYSLALCPIKPYISLDLIPQSYGCLRPFNTIFLIAKEMFLANFISLYNHYIKSFSPSYHCVIKAFLFSLSSQSLEVSGHLVIFLFSHKLNHCSILQMTQQLL